MSKISKRQLAARFIELLDTADLKPAAAALIATALDAGYNAEDLQDVVKAVEQELLTRHGAAEIQITTAHELPVATLNELASQIAKQAGIAYPTYYHAIDPDLLGGFEAEAGDMSIRASVRSQLERLGAAHG